ncbi:MAG: ABC transporter ATP-binding protein [Bacillota bacterium]|jgi:ABC-2 type transport system ATP-binding protein|nr:ABC transporter ATP-binding protein [Bacillota bacterium]
MIQARGLTKRYGDMFAVDGLDLDVEAGEIFGFLGPNGAGKTTTINMLIGITAPTSGTVTLGGVNVHTDPEKAKAMVGYVPDQPNMYDKLTAWEFLMFVANLYGMDRKRAERRAWQLLEMFELTDRAREQTGGFSHGMKQKTVIAAALLHEPRILFMDEPTVGLDPRSARQVKDILRELAREGCTVFLTTHVLEIAERMCDRIGIIQKGKLLTVGTMEDLRRAASAKGAPAAVNGSTLEDLFLELTGGADYAEVSRYLEG